jgi:Mor family transcriptional regulator
MVMDLIDRMIERLKHIEPALGEDRAEALERVLREEFAGEVVRVRKRGRNSDIEQAVRERFNGRNVAELAKELGVHRATVYRVLSSALHRS